jgi:acetyl-CoA C-acetyltransferase
VTEAFVLETLRTAGTRVSARSGFAGGRTGVDPERIEDVIIGCASQKGEQGANIARTATLRAGWGDVPGVTINRFCVSGIDAVAQAGGRIRGGILS